MEMHTITQSAKRSSEETGKRREASRVRAKVNRPRRDERRGRNLEWIVQWVLIERQPGGRSCAPYCKAATPPSALDAAYACDARTRPRRGTHAGAIGCVKAGRPPQPQAADDVTDPPFRPCPDAGRSGAGGRQSSRGAVQRSVSGVAQAVLSVMALCFPRVQFKQQGVDRA